MIIIKLEKIVDYFNENIIYLLRYFIYAIIILAFTIKFEYNDYDYNQTNRKSLEYDTDESNEFINFEGFDNNGGCNKYIVPNLIHYVHLDQTEISFSTFLSILSAWVNHRPDFIYLHCNDCSYRGKYWQALINITNLNEKIVIKRLKNSNMKIFNQNHGYIHHKSDVLRLLILMNYGGIYLDNDVIIVNSFDKYRKFEMVVSWDR